MSEHGWKGMKVRHSDGRAGIIQDEWPGFMHICLKIQAEDGSEAIVQLNVGGPDTGATGWQWLCTNFGGGAAWLPLGDHSGCEVEPAHDR